MACNLVYLNSIFKKILFKIIFLLFIFVTQIVFSEDLPILGIVEIVPKEGISASEAHFLTKFVFDAVYKFGSNKYTIIARSKRDEILEEMKFVLSDLCDSESCAIEAGGYLAADYIIFGSCGKYGTNYHLTLQIVNVNTTIIVGSSREKSASIDGLESIINKSVLELLPLPPREKEKFIKYEYPQRSAGIIILVGGLSCIGGGFGTYYFHIEAQKEAENALETYNNALNTEADHDALWEDAASKYKNSQILLWSSVGLWTVGAILTGISFYMISNKVEVINSISLNIIPQKDNIVFALNMRF